MRRCPICGLEAAIRSRCVLSLHGTGFAQWGPMRGIFQVWVCAALFTASSVSAQVIVLDPGHGGSDPGAVGCGLEEEDVVLDIALRTRDLLRRDGLTVHLTRSDDRYISLSGRASFANDRGASRYVSIHANANAGTPATGTETFVYTSASSASRDLGSKLQSEMISAWGLRDRGLKTANFAVIRLTSMPAALTETGFINNCGTDSARLGSATRRQEMAVAHYRAVMRSLGRTPGSAPPPVDPPPPPPASGGRLLGAAFEDTGAGLEDTSRRVLGATARIRETGASTAVDGSGLFSFSVSDGTYTVEVSASGYATATRTCTVAGSDTWCSVGVTRAASGGRARGVVFEDTGAGFADTSTRLGGATVRIVETGATVPVDGSGNWSVSLASGSYTLQVSAAGFATATRSCNIAGSEAWCSVGLSRTAAAGTLQGVLYEGTISRRIGSATVRIVENGRSVVSRGHDGYWSFEIAPGTYTVEASGSGLVTTTRRCTVESRRETWCSMSVARDGRGGGEELIIETDPADDTVVMDPTFDGGPRGELGTVGCAAGGSGHAAWLFAMLLAFGVRRRTRPETLPRGRTFGLLVAGLAVLGCGTDTESAPTAALDQEEVVNVVEVAANGGAFASVVDIQPIAEGTWADLALSPDGQRVALSHPALGGLSVAEVGEGLAEVDVVREAPNAGLNPIWRADSQALGIRVEGQTSTAVPTLSHALDGTAALPVQLPTPLATRVDRGAIEVGRGLSAERLGPPGDQYFAPRVSPDGEWVTFEGLSTGLYVHRLDQGATTHLGVGAHARFDPTSRWIVFERVEDDGHQITAGDLMIVDLHAETPEVATLLADAGAIDRAPDVVGDRVVFLRNDRAMRATLRTSR